MATSVKEQQTKKKQHCSYNKCVYEGKKPSPKNLVEDK